MKFHGLRLTLLGLRWQSAAATPLLSGRAASDSSLDFHAVESGVALRFPPHSKTVSLRADVVEADGEIGKMPSCTSIS